jgi:hypothetical protein
MDNIHDTPTVNFPLFAAVAYRNWGPSKHKLGMLLVKESYETVQNKMVQPDTRKYKRGSISGRGKRSLLQSIKTGSGTHPASHQMGTGGSFHGGKVAGRESDHTTPSSVDVKNGGAMLHSPYVFLTWWLSN